MTRPPKRCFTCQRNRVAWVKPRVDFCYACLPGGPFPEPACGDCQSPNYFSDGLCDACHPGGPLHLGSCRGCLAWGVLRAHSWRCWSCRWWATHYPIGDCLYCGRNTRIADRGACRLCLDQGRFMAAKGHVVDLDEATRYGQQLYLANMRQPRLKKRPADRPIGRRSKRAVSTAFVPPTSQQLQLLDVPHDPDGVRRQALTADTDLIRYCADVVRTHGTKHGWSKRQTNDVIASLRIMQVLQDTPTAKVNATDVEQLSRYGGNVGSTLEVLDAAGLLNDDRQSRTEQYFAAKTADLPAPMVEQLEVWLEVMLDGSSTAPRRQARDPQTTRIHILGIAPILHAWAANGHRSLSEITQAQVREALPESGSQRNFAEYGLRSLFGVLKSRKLIFTNPTAGMATTRVNATVPLPLDTESVRQALNSPNPATALAVALVAFHALTAKEVQNLQLTDIVDGRLHINNRNIPLADPVLSRLTAWLNHRAVKWPGSINTHLFVGMRNAPRLGPVGRQFTWTNTDLRPQTLREDRILQEIHTNGGDIRRICDLFGLSVSAATRYAGTVAHPDLEKT